MKYEIKRGKRKTLSITVKNAKVTVNAPTFASSKSIDQFVDSKKDWIEKHLKNQLNQEKQKKTFNPDYGSDILFLGKSLRVTGADFMDAFIAGDKLLLPLNLGKEELKQLIKYFYKRKAEEIIGEKVKIFSGEMGVIPNNIKITEARTRWGSCSGKGNVNFSWYLIMAPVQQVDYVVVHELAHIREMNHSGSFWQIVGKYIPDHRERRKELKVLNQRLMTENWG